MNNETASAKGNEEYRIVDIDGNEVGHITRQTYMPVEIFIRSNRSDFQGIAKLLNERIFEGKDIVGADGACKVMTEEFDREQQSSLFTKINSMSRGELRVVCAQE